MKRQEAIHSPGTLAPIGSLVGLQPYRVPRHPAPVDLILDGNEGPAPSQDVLAAVVTAGPELVRRYPSTASLERLLGQRLGLDAACVLVTAGADDAIDRCCRAFLSPGREMVLPTPTFEMLHRYAVNVGATIKTLDWWGGPYPTQAVLQQVTPDTRLVAVITPNNPTGAVATAQDICTLAAAAPHALVLVDLAYGEFSDVDLTLEVLKLPNVVVTRTLSKAWGMAGLRVGYALGPPRVLGWLRAIGQPYAVAAPSLLMAETRLRQPEGPSIQHVARVKMERIQLQQLLVSLGVEVQPSQANFVFARTPRALWLRDGLAGLGISVRAWPGHSTLQHCLRITCPGDGALFDRLCAGLEAVLSPQALLLDMDGPLADVSGSYRRAIMDTAAQWGVTVTPQDIAAVKAEGHANNDWVVTHRLVQRGGVTVPFEDVKARFEALYQGTAAQPGLWRQEPLVPAREVLERLSRRLPLGVVTGRPRQDAVRFLEMHGVADLFGVVVCMEDAPLKPDPAPVALALRRHGVQRAWMVGDTPDDVVAAQRAGVVPLGMPAVGQQDADALVRSGAARVVNNLGAVEELLP